MLEIELKFKYNDDIYSKLDQLHAKYIKTFTVIDKYFDNREKVSLFSNDYWLRERIIDDLNTYELKYPYDNDCKDTLVCKYYETQNEIEICNFITKLLGINDSCFNKSVEKLISYLKMEPIVIIETKRKTYQHKNIKIDLDETNFGYRIGEIEILGQNGDYNQADEQLNDLAKNLGLNNLKKTPSKVYEYLKLFENDIFNKLYLKYTRIFMQIFNENGP